MTFRTCSLCSIPSTWARSSSRSSSKNSPSTLASLKALVYCWSESVSSQRQTSVTDQRRTSLGKGSALDCLACSSAFRAASSSSCCFLSAASITSSAPSFKCLIAGMFAAAAAAAAAEAASALEAMAAEVVSELISRICLSMLRDEKYDSDMDMNWNFMSSSVCWNMAAERFSCSRARAAVALAAAALVAVAVSSSMPFSRSASSSYFCSWSSSIRLRCSRWNSRSLRMRVASISAIEISSLDSACFFRCTSWNTAANSASSSCGGDGRVW